MKLASKTGRPVPSVQRPVPAASPVILESHGFHIRSLRPHDASEKLSSWLADPDMMWGLNIPGRDWPIEKQQAFILSFDNRKRYLIGIFCKGDRGADRVLHTRGQSDPSDRTYLGRDRRSGLLGKECLGGDDSGTSGLPVQDTGNRGRWWRGSFSPTGAFSSAS